ncbi:MAG: hypothetical protein R2717_00590 [Schumannella sp.]
MTENLGVARFAAGRRARSETLDFVYELFPKLDGSASGRPAASRGESSRWSPSAGR